MNAVNERSASSTRRIKNWLRSKMSQDRLNNCLLLSIHKGKTDKIKLRNVTNVFCEVNEDGRPIFGIFCNRDFLQLNASRVDIFKKTTC